jgi:tetratricopeptide (TPR) repeat protein
MDDETDTHDRFREGPGICQNHVTEIVAIAQYLLFINNYFHRLAREHTRPMSSTAFRETLDRALAAHRAGRLEDALAGYRAAQSLRPDDPEAASLTGLALVQSGRTAEGLPLLERAAELAPADPGVRFNLGEGCVYAGASDRALEVFRQVLELKPGFVAAWSRIGDLEAQRGNDAGAAHAWSEALEVDPAAVHPTARLAELALRYGDSDKAISLLEIGLSQHPTHDRLLGVLCEVLAARREWGRLGTTARAWADARPELPDPWKQLSRAAFELGRANDAVQGYSNYLMRGRHDATDLAAYASLCLHALDFDAAEAALVAAEELDAQHPEVLARRALLHMYRGRFDAAAEAAQRCLERQPDNVAVYTVLSRLRQGRLDEAQLGRLHAIAARTDAPFDYRIPAAFAVAHAADARAIADAPAADERVADQRMEDVAAAFAAYTHAHDLALARDVAEDRRYDREGQAQRTRRLRELFPGVLAPDAHAAVSLPPSPVPRRPVFIVGMPRSGTTLVEAVLGAHPRVHACGERGAMPRILGNHLALADEGRAPDAARLAQWAAAYLAEPAAPEGRDVLTDKQPLNFGAVGLIAQLFPDAVILHLRRDPLETLLSIWRQEFAKSWAFTHRLEDLGHYYGEYARLMAHWEQAFPGRIVTLRYEDIASDLGAAAPRLLEACGLDWDPQVLDYASLERPIATFSTVDARGPVSVRRGRAARYIAHLGPLVDALRAAGVDPATGELGA